MPDVQAVPEHLRTVTPRLVLPDSAAAIAFYVNAFGAEELGRFSLPDGKIVHAEIRIGNSVLFLTDEGSDGNAVAPDSVERRVTMILALSVPDVDRVWARAVAAGCEVIYPLANHFYGDRGGRLCDPFGHQWMLSTHVEDVSPEEMDRRLRAQSGG